MNKMDMILKLVGIFYIYALQHTFADALDNKVSAKPFQLDFPAFSTDVLLDTWEPQVIALSNNEIVVFALNQYGVKACADCGADPIIYRKTSTNGASWEQINGSNTWNYISDYPLTWFADIVVVKDSSDNLYITYIGYTKSVPPNPWNILFQFSTDRGETWSAPVSVSGNVSADKNWMAIDPSNPKKLYVTFNSQFPYAVSSSDGGASWSAPVLMDEMDGSYFYAGGGGVRSEGTVFFAYSATPDYGTEVEEDTSSAYSPALDESNSTANLTYARVYSSSDSGTNSQIYMGKSGVNSCFSP